MFYTDTAARLKECPLRSDKNTNVLCVGSDCLAWGWAPEHIKDHEPDGPPQPDWLGYCGELQTQ